MPNSTRQIDARGWCCQGKSRKSVANAIANPELMMAKDANENPNDVKKLTVTTDATDKLAVITAIPAGDAPHNEVVTVNGASFSATAGKSYVFEYTYTENSETKKAYKVIKVAAGS